MNSTASTVPLWERSTLQDAAGKTLRPGGLALTDRALSLTNFPAHSRILDVGCGLGATVEHLNNVHHFKGYGIDISAKQLSQAPSDMRLTLANADILPFADDSFDGIICECVLSLLPDISKTIGEFRRVLNSTGTLIITDIYQRGQNSSGSISGSCATNPLNISILEKTISNHKFHTIIKEDHSKLLAELAARLIFTGEKSIIPKGNCCSKPGYMLLIAKQS
ncbi:DVU_1556 family methyltransferase [Desulfovibrio gilichinskyi]|uniref:Methyltransferase domain-containing protein n=1 Tax=Desulfovibrio gilichinskyi TaxID=1519643 RepID=A0A1X7E5W8_9BACT|nr:class I SAM-dependent methyltransferase [Desulfovibrio gilichinskyi]SMF28139.1 Methyltransferase domain-containing protein [Desulfovibrio gilichinskyi]